MRWCARVFMAASVLASLARPALAQEATVQGRVHDDEGAAVSGVIVVVLQDSEVVAGTDTDVLGSFRISLLPPGTYQLRVGGIGYEEHTEPISLTDGATLDVEVTVARRAIELPGISVDAAASRERIRFEELGAPRYAS